MDIDENYGAREPLFCSEQCRYSWHNMNKKIERKKNSINKMIGELYYMLNETEDKEQRKQIEKLAYELKSIGE